MQEQDPSVVYRFFEVEDSREGKKHSKVAWSLGLKRNIACCLTRGAAIVHFDDDDLYAEGYLPWMQQRLVSACKGDVWLTKPAVVKLTEWYTLDMAHNAFRFLDVFKDANVPPRERRGWLYGWGFSYVFTRSAWELAPFPDVEFAEDIGFLEGLMARDVPVSLVQLPWPAEGARPQCLVSHSLHPDSTSGGEFDGRRRSGQAVATPTEVRHLLAIVQNILSTTKSAAGLSRSSRFAQFARPGLPVSNGGKFQQPSFRIEKGGVSVHHSPFQSFGLAPHLKGPGAKFAAR
mmetsp:Transcript_79363/g.236470  ORF Transcript_79363/g.236470 Transcript_79363/m.236470 type:complete len:289 (+) Transcript_79363:3-869(+)